MDTQFILIFGDILSGGEQPRIIEFTKAPTADDSGFVVGSGHSVASKNGFIGKSTFLESHKELKEVFSRMQVGDVAERNDRTDGTFWNIKDKKGEIRHSIHVPET